MPDYYVSRNAQPNGDHEVHRWDDCPTPVNQRDRRYLGWFPSCHGAVTRAKLIYPTANGCKNCSPLCHTAK